MPILQWIADWFWLHTWWSFGSSEDPLHAWFYRSINLIEGLFRLGFAAAVLIRQHKHQRRRRLSEPPGLQS